MRLIGNQIRETIPQAGLELLTKRGELALLRDEFGGHEIYTENDQRPGYVLEIDGVGHEFVRAATSEEVIEFLIV